MRTRAFEAAFSVLTDPASPGPNINIGTAEELMAVEQCAQMATDAALLAALDPEDEALVEAWAKAHWNGSPLSRLTAEPTTSTTRPYEWRGSPVLWDDDDMSEEDRETTRRGVRASVAFLRQMAQGAPND